MGEQNFNRASCLHLFRRINFSLKVLRDTKANRMLACVLSVVALATAAWGQDVEPNKCCVDKTFMGQVSAVGGTYYPITGNVQFEDSYTFFAYDYYNKVVGAEFHLRLKNGSEQVTRSLLDYNTDTQYITTDNTSCVMTKIGMPMEDPCVPAGARYLGASKVGYGAACPSSAPTTAPSTAHPRTASRCTADTIPAFLLTSPPPSRPQSTRTRSAPRLIP